MCRDAIRLALHGGRFVRWAEDMVATVDRLMVRSLFIAGHNTVIVDESNVTRKLRESWYDPYWHVMYWIVSTPPAECIRRALAEGDEYIVPVIERMAGEWEDPYYERHDYFERRFVKIKPLPACGGPEGRTQ